MGRAGKALKQVLETYNISQNQLAVTMGIDRSNISRWVSESRDPSAEAAVEIRQALEKIDPSAAEAFVKLYIYGLTDKKEK
jgi:transcriptional regulator with XRE-family HTH domain